MPDEFTLDTALGRMAREVLPWEEAWKVRFEEFSNCFTLHDSTWVGVFLAVGEGNDGVLVVEWDSHWLPASVRSKCLEGEAQPPRLRNPFLFIRLSKLRDVQLRNFAAPMSDCPISVAESWVKNSCNVLEISDILDGIVHLEFEGQSEFLAIRRQDGLPLEIANTGPRQEAREPTRPWWRLW